MLLTTKTILSSADVERAVQKVLSEAPTWKKYPDRIRTLGTPSYKQPDARCDLDVLFENQRLMHNFSQLYSCVTKACEEILQQDVFVDPMLPVPGFHIHVTEECHERFEAAPWHIDKSFLNVPRLANAEDKDGHHFSVLLSLSTPHSGTSTDFLLSPSGEYSREFYAKADSWYSVTHAPGKMIFFNSHLVHRISKFDLTGESDCRITLQGHLVLRDGRWVYYW